MFSLCLCNKVPYILMKSSYYYLFSISFWICVCLHILCIKVYRKTSVGEAHCNIKIKFDHENHESQKAIEQKPCSPKLDQNGPESGLPGLLHGPYGPSQRRLISHYVHGQVRAQCTLFLYVSLSVSNQIKNHLIKQL